MARQPRFAVPGIPQHVIQRGNNRQEIFRSDSDYSWFLRWLGESIAVHQVQLHSYVLMTNHVHLLATPLEPDSIGRVMQSLGRRYVQYFNFKYDRTGTLWEGRYRATVIDSDEYFLTCSRYIEQNPMRAGMVAIPAQYRWSSFRCNALGRHDSLVCYGVVYERLGRTPAERQEAYQEFSRTPTSEESLLAIREATAKAWALGNPNFRSRVQELSGRRPDPKGRGRPRKNRV